MCSLSGICGDDGAIQKGSHIRSQEQSNVCDLFGLRKAMLRVVAFYEGKHFGIIHPSGSDLCAGKAGGNGVDPDIAVRVFDGSCLGQSGDGVFCANIWSHAVICDQSGYGCDIDDRAAGFIFQ